jgi:cytochrome P450
MKYNFPPHPKKTHWLLGNLFYIAQDKLKFFFENRKEMGTFYNVKNPIRNLVVLTNPEWVKYVLVDNNKNFTKSFAYEPIRLLLGNGLLTSEGNFWKQQRRLIQPAFYKESIAKMSVIMLEEAEILSKKWEQNARDKIKVSATDDFYSFALNIVTKSLFITEINDKINDINTLVTKAMEIGSYRIEHPFLPPIWFPSKKNIEDKKVLKQLDDLIYGIIEDRRKSGKMHNDLLDLLIYSRDEETGQQMSNQQLRDEVITLFMAGHETTAVALTWLSLLLARHPESHKKAVDELNKILPNNKKPDYESVRQMEYLKCIIDETMRLYPPAWAVGRKTINDDTIDGYHLPANTNIVMPIIVIHRDEEIWGDASTFRPERFLPEGMKEKHKYAYFPFGGGPRLCIGNNFAYMSLYMALALILPKFEFELDKDYEEILNPLITLRSTNPIFLHLKLRT